LLREGLPPDRVIKTGSPMYEVLHHYLPQIEASDALARLGLTAGEYFVISAHREENVDSPGQFAALIEVLTRLAENMAVASSCPPIRARANGWRRKG
jgi:UDP-N-acetyl-L-fucosamine synthase